jgi:hypothetical protein
MLPKSGILQLGVNCTTWSQQVSGSGWETLLAVGLF